VSTTPQPHLLVVGAFPKGDSKIFGGMVTSCKALLQSSLPRQVRLELLDSTQISVPPPSFPVRLGYAMWRVARYVHRLERRKPDAVLLFVAIGASVAEKGVMAWYARLRGVQALMFPRGGEIIEASAGSRMTRFWVRLAFRGASVMLCQSPKWRDFAQSLGFSGARAAVIPNWTATPDLLAIGKARHRSSDAPAKLLFLGWLDRAKGVGELLEACLRLKPGHCFTLDIAGEGKYSREARAYVERNGLSDIVRFRGWITGDELHAAFAESNVLVLPSYVEGLPNAMVEAMAAGLAVVVTGVGSIPDVVADEHDALVIGPRDVDALERALRRVIEDVPLRDRLGTAACARAEAQFAVEPAVEKIVGVVREAMSMRDQRQPRKSTSRPA